MNEFLIQFLSNDKSREPVFFTGIHALNAFANKLFPYKNEKSSNLNFISFFLLVVTNPD
jgi:hypothetical protein